MTWNVEYKTVYNREYHKHRYANDPTYRQRKIENARKQHSAPDYNEKRRAKKYDPIWRKKENERKRYWKQGIGSIKTCLTPHSPELSKLLNEQGFACKICLEPFGNNNKPHIDHCHKSGTPRGVLCIRCNTGLGKFKDSPDLLRAALDYLAR